MTPRRAGWGIALAGACALTWGAWSLTAQEGEAPAGPAERIAQLERRAQAEPRPDLFFELGRLRLAQGDPDGGMRDLARAVKIAPQGHYVQTYFVHQLDKAHFAGRLDLLEALEKLAPDYPPLLDRLGRVYQGRGRDQEAEALLTRWVRVRPESPEPYAALAEFYRATGRPKEAIPHLEKVRTLMGESTYALRRLGVLYRESGNLDASAARLETAIAAAAKVRADAAGKVPGLKPGEAETDVVALLELGHTRLAQRRAGDAVSAFREAVALDPESPAMRLFLAQAEVEAGDAKAARASYEKAVALDRFSLEAQLGLGRLLLAQGDPKAALPHLREASSRNDRDPELHFLVGETALKAGDTATAEREHAKLKQIRSTTLARKLHDLIEAAP